MSTEYQHQIFTRLEPQGEFKGGRIVDTDLLTLDEAAKYASKHAGVEIAPSDYLRAASRGEITLRAIVRSGAKLLKHDGGVYCNQGEPTENTLPKGAILNLPLIACRQLANAGRASWRTFDGFEQIDGELMRFTVATLTDDEIDFETVLDDCRVIGFDVHALADAFLPAPSGAPEKAAPPVKISRTNKTHAILQSFIAAGVPASIESIWAHIRANVGKPNFPYKGASVDVALDMDGDSILKTKMERSLRSLLKKS